MRYCCTAFEDLVNTGIVVRRYRVWVLQTDAGTIYVHFCPSCGTPTSELKDTAS